jgi:hypothetical protein
MAYSFSVFFIILINIQLFSIFLVLKFVFVKIHA